MEQELQRANAIQFECDLLHDLITDLYENLVDKDYPKTKEVIKQSIKNLNQILKQLDDDI